MATQPNSAPVAAAAVVEMPKPQSLLDRILEQQADVASRYKPVMSLEEFKQREETLDYLVKHVLIEGVDYGWIPGTKPKEDAKPGEYQAKPTLFKSGAEKACVFFGYVPSYDVEEEIEAWTAEQYGEMLFYYKYRCSLLKDGKAVGQGIGSATTWESKYRYRNAERTCPACGIPNIRKSRPKPGQKGDAGWYCWQKTNGCGAEFAPDDLRIVGQEVGKIPNPDVSDVINTVQKMGQKRAYVAATLTATGLSGRFTQDMEDLPAPPEPRQNGQPGPQQAPRAAAGPQSGPQAQAPQQAQQAPAEPETIEHQIARRVNDRKTGSAVFTEFGNQLASIVGEVAAQQEIGRLLQKHDAPAFEKLKTVGAARAFCVDLHHLIQVAKKQEEDALPFDEPGQEASDAN